MPPIAPEYVTVGDLERFQHYKDRCPPWVKVHWAMLDDPRFVDLSEANRHRYIMCILLASRLDNRIKNDPLYLAKMMRLSEPVDLTQLIEAGLLLAWRKQRASAAQAKRSSEKRKDRDREEKRGSAFRNGRRVGIERAGSTVSSLIHQTLNAREKDILDRNPHLRDTE